MDSVRKIVFSIIILLKIYVYTERDVTLKFVNFVVKKNDARL